MSKYYCTLTAVPITDIIVTPVVLIISISIETPIIALACFSSACVFNFSKAFSFAASNPFS